MSLATRVTGGGLPKGSSLTILAERLAAVAHHRGVPAVTVKDATPVRTLVLYSSAAGREMPIDCRDGNEYSWAKAHHAYSIGNRRVHVLFCTNGGRPIETPSQSAKEWCFFVLAASPVYALANSPQQSSRPQSLQMPDLYEPIEGRVPTYTVTSYISGRRRGGLI